MTPDRTAPLTPEERELAQRLARIATPGDPPPALDSRILAAARAAVAGPAPPARHPRRWPVVFGVAASLALAVGIAWQLRPLPDAPTEYSEAPAAAPTGTESADDDATRPAAQATDAAALPAASGRTHPPSPVAAGEGAAAARPVPQAFPQPEQRKAASAAQAAAAVVPEAPQVAPAVPPPPIAPAAATAGNEAGAARDAASSRDATANRQDAGGLAPRDAATSEYGDQSIDDQPPATADAPEVRQAWLQRIRELIAAGETDAARASLQEFRRRYPDAVLPEDLRAFDE